MSKEIKYGTEFLDKLKDDVHDLFDENTQLKADLHEVRDNAIWWQNRFNSEYMQKRELQQRNDKAIEYIKNNYPVCAGADLLKILSGEDNE